MSPRASTTTTSRRRRSGCRPSDRPPRYDGRLRGDASPGRRCDPRLDVPDARGLRRCGRGARGLTRPAAPGTDAPATLRSALGGVRAFILDADGVLDPGRRADPGAFDAVRRLVELGYPVPRRHELLVGPPEPLAGRFGKATGLTVAGEFITGASAAAAIHGDASPRRAAVRPGGPGRAARVGRPGGPLADEADARRRDRRSGRHRRRAATTCPTATSTSPFAQIRGGAEFVAMHRNPWWMTPSGVTLDAGAWVAGLEYALGRRAMVCGKPSPVVFRQAVAELRACRGRSGRSDSPARREVAMVGDDPEADVAGVAAGRAARVPRPDRQGRCGGEPSRRTAPRSAQLARRTRPPSPPSLAEARRRARLSR